MQVVGGMDRLPAARLRNSIAYRAAVREIRQGERGVRATYADADGRLRRVDAMRHRLLIGRFRSAPAAVSAWARCAVMFAMEGAAARQPSVGPSRLEPRRGSDASKSALTLHPCVVRLNATASVMPNVVVPSFQARRSTLT